MNGDKQVVSISVIDCKYLSRLERILVVLKLSPTFNNPSAPTLYSCIMIKSGSYYLHQTADNWSLRYLQPDLQRLTLTHAYMHIWNIWTLKLLQRAMHKIIVLLPLYCIARPNTESSIGKPSRKRRLLFGKVFNLAAQVAGLANLKNGSVNCTPRLAMRDPLAVWAGIGLPWWPDPPT